MTDSPNEPWRRARRILAVRTDNLGDVLMTTPALAAIKQTGASVTLLASPSGSCLAPHLPIVDDWIVTRAPWVKHADGQAPDDPQQLAEEIARRQFDAAVIFTTYTQSALPAALIALLARIPLRLAHVRENPYALLTHWVREVEPAVTRHEVERQLALVSTVGFAIEDSRLRFGLRNCDIDAARVRLSRLGIDSPYIVVHPGASAPSRRYPAERFGAAARAIARRTQRQIVFIGAPDEALLVAQARAHAGDDIASAAITDQVSVGELAAIIADAELIVCNNSGPAHIAAALRTPVVDLYALTNPQHTPWSVASRVLNRDVPCRNCLSSVCGQGHHLCLQGVAAAEVADAAIELVSSRVPELSAA